MRRVAGFFTALALVFISSPAAPQSAGGVNLSDFQSTLNAANAATNDQNVSDNLPGYQGNATNLQGMSGNSVSQLQSAGQTAGASDPLSPIVSNANTYQSNNAISSNAAWVQNALNVQANPTATAGTTTGTSTQTCTTSTPTTTTTHSLYTCESGQTVSDTNSTCTQIYVPTIKEDYIYQCNANWQDGQANLVPDARCTTLAGQSACALTAQTCTTASTTENYNYSCSSGQSYTPSSAACTTNTSESTWGYVCNDQWVDGDAALVPSAACAALASSSSCSKTGSTCTQAGVQQSDSYSTFVGTQYTPSTAQCTTNTSISQYNYQCQSNWVDGQGQLVPDAACSALATSGVCTQTNAQCTTNGTSQSQSYSCYSGTSYAQNSGTCDITHSVTGTTPTQWTYTISGDDAAAEYGARANYTIGGVPIYNSQSFPYYYFCQQSFNGDVTQNCSYFENSAFNPPAGNYATAAQWQAAVAAHPVTCFEIGAGQSGVVGITSLPYGSNTLLFACTASGISKPGITYWKQADFSNQAFLASSSADGCNQTGNTVGVQQWNDYYVEETQTFTCASQVSGYTATSSNGGYSDGGVNASACTTYSSNSACTKTNAVCNSYIDPAAAAALGLPANTCADETDSYTCTTSSPVNYCTGQQPSGSGWTDTTQTECSSTYNGSCAVNETDYTWTRETGIGNCTQEEISYSCTADVPAADPAVSISTSTDSSACQSIASNSACQPTGTTCAQMTTYSAAQLASMGLSANFCAQTTNSYTCTSSAPVNYTTGAPPSGSGWSCTSTQQCNPSGNQSCAIQETDFSCSRTTGVNSCVTQQDSYTCTSDVAAADPAQTISMSTDSSQCQSLASNSSCSVTSTSCAQMTSYTASQLAALGLSANYCQQTTYNYTCAGWTATNSCTAQAPSGTGWSCTSSQACQASGPNACAITVTSYACSRVDGVNGCQQSTSTYDCSQDVPPADPYQNLIKTITGGNWQYSPACSQATDSTCQLQGQVCTDTTPTKTVDGVSVSAPCWAQTMSYQCEAVTGTMNDCQVPSSSCTLKTQTCLSTDSTDLTGCTMVQSEYDCTSSTTTPASGPTCTTSWTNGANSITAQDDPNNDLASAASGLNAVDQATKSQQSSSDLQIFDGQNLQCKKGIAGLYNCCKDSGLLLGNLVSCSSDEKTLYAQQSSKSCHYVGTYCSNKSLFGVCLEKKMTYCCFGSSLARIIQEAGHSQLNLPWGSAKSPSCGGFSVSQFQQIDLTNVDFSDFYNDKLSTLSGQDPTSTVAAITASINNMNANKSPTN